MSKDVISIQLHSTNSRVIEGAVGIDWEILVLIESVSKSTKTSSEVVGSIGVCDKLSSWVIHISNFKNVVNGWSSE